MEIFIWIAILLIFLTIEVIRVKITYICISIGAIWGMIAHAIGLSFLLQLMFFLIATIVLLVTLKPIVSQKIKKDLKRKELKNRMKNTQDTK